MWADFDAYWDGSFVTKLNINKPNHPLWPKLIGCAQTQLHVLYLCLTCGSNRKCPPLKPP